MWHGYHGWNGMWPFPIIMIIIVVIGLYLIFRPKYPMNSKTDETALEILQKRYASGEVSKEEFEQVKKDILAD